MKPDPQPHGRRLLPPLYRDAIRRYELEEDAFSRLIEQGFDEDASHRLAREYTLIASQAGAERESERPASSSP